MDEHSATDGATAAPAGHSPGGDDGPAGHVLVGPEAGSGERDAATGATGPTPDEVIRTEGLTKVYPGGVTAVDGLSLSVGRGEIFALLGPNGAGKTTTVGMLTTRVVPTEGTARVDGIDVVAAPARAKQVIGVVNQLNTLDRSLTAWENLYFHGRYFAMSDRRATAAADEALERFRLTARAGARVDTLSGGMARRLMLARSILHRPAVLFLDEPTAGLDPQSRLALWEIVADLHAEGETILLTTHYMEEADRLADRVAIMDRGRILALDRPDALKRSFGVGPAVVLKGEGDAARLAQRLSGVAGVTDAAPADGGVRLTLRETGGVVAEVIAATYREGFRLTDLSVAEATLEAVFINLTGKELRE